MIYVTILLSNCSFENIFSHCIDDNFSIFINYIYSEIYLIYFVTILFLLRIKEKIGHIFISCLLHDIFCVVTLFCICYTFFFNIYIHSHSLSFLNNKEKNRTYTVVTFCFNSSIYTYMFVIYVLFCEVSSHIFWWCFGLLFSRYSFFLLIGRCYMFDDGP